MTEKNNVVDMAAAKEEIYGSLEEMVADGASQVEYAECDGFTPGKKIRIGSVTAGDMILWSEGNERGGEEKRTAGLRLIAQSLVSSEATGSKRYAAGSPSELKANIEKMRTMRHKETERVVKEILDLNGMTAKKDKEAKND